MKIEVIDGLDIVSIGLNGLGSYFRVNSPVSFVWADCRGSVGQYMCLLPFSEQDKQVLYKRIMDNLNEDFTERTEELYNILKPLFQLFENGEYELVFDNGTRKHEAVIYSGDKSETYYPSRYVQYGNKVDLLTKDLLVKTHKKELIARGLEERRYDLVDYTTTGLYDWRNTIYFATRPQEEIDAERVAYYEQEIKKGHRPFAIVMNANYYEADIRSEYFVLDGHHKFQAYQNLQIDPPVAFIDRRFRNELEIEFDLESLARTLYPWQVKHMLENLDDRDVLVVRFLEDPNSKLHEFIRNGEVKEYHDNKKLKHHGLYHNDHPEGTIKEWYDNGNLKYEHHYKDGKKVGTWKEWYIGSNTQAGFSYNDEGQRHGQSVSYFNNGLKKTEQLFVNGEMEGYGYRYGNLTGKLEYEFWYKEGKLVEQKSYDDQGGLTRHEKYAPELGKLVPVEIPMKIRNPKYYQYQQELENNKNTYTLRMILLIISMIITLIKLIMS